MWHYNYSCELSMVLIGAPFFQNVRGGGGEVGVEGRRVQFVCLLVAYRPSNRQVYLRDGSAQTILRAATLR